MITKIYCPDIECDSCVRVIGKRLSKLEGVTNHSITKECAEIEHDNSVDEKRLIDLFENAGFRASIEPFERKTFKERMRHIRENKALYHLELSALKNALWIFLVLSALEIIAYFGIFSNKPGFLEHYWVWFLYLNISIASIGSALWHFYSYRSYVTCMTGMMVGMAFGMQAGMMIGAVVGATNGFFTGSLVGMVLAVFLGMISGKEGGTMGLMQGMMAGIMGGTMGPMISVMMFSDHLDIFMPLYMLFNLVLTFSIVLMTFEELAENKKHSKMKVSFTYLISACVLAAAILSLVMVYGPKSPLFMF